MLLFYLFIVCKGMTSGNSCAAIGGGTASLIMEAERKQFYSSKAWQDCRNAYAKSKRNLCELCLDKGILSTGEIVHHKIHLSADNFHDPSVALNWDNLQLLCRDCHAKQHSNKRYRVDELGQVIF